MPADPLQLFALNTSRLFGEHVAHSLGLPLSPHEERDFEDGEHKVRALAGVRGRDVYVVHSLHGDATYSVNDKLCRLLFFVGALKDAAAARITAVVPYLAYTRKDARTNPRDPLTLRYVASMFEVAGSASVVTLDVHNASAYQNAFRCNTEHLDACSLFASHFRPLVQGAGVAVVSPDTGGVKRAYRFRQCLERELDTTVDTAFCEKYRKADRLSGELLAGNVAGKTAILYDDMISSGQTMARAARVCLQHGAVRVFAAASHALFGAATLELLADAGIARLVVTDSAGTVTPATVPRLQLDVVSCAGLFAEAIKRMHEGGSVSELATW